MSVPEQAPPSAVGRRAVWDEATRVAYEWLRVFKMIQPFSHRAWVSGGLAMHMVHWSGVSGVVSKARLLLSRCETLRACSKFQGTVHVVSLTVCFFETVRLRLDGTGQHLSNWEGTSAYSSGD